MKKQALVAAILAATTLSATPAFAAQNPFKDMPEGHWAYDAVNMLVKDGVVDGYGDGTFGGDKLMNRYEMAEIVAKAAEKYGSVGMKDKGAIKKLTREFKAELKDMDARLTGVEQQVAELRKGQSSFKWYGDTRLRYFQNKDNQMIHPDANNSNPSGKERQWEKRVRLGLWGTPAKNLSVDGRIKYEDTTGAHKGTRWDSSDPDNANFNTWDDSVRNQNNFKLDKLSLFWDNAGTRVAVGRNEFNLGQGGIWWENSMDGAYVSHQFGPKLNIMAGYGDMSAEGWQDTNMWAYFTNTTFKASPATTFTFATLHTNSDLESHNTELKTDVSQTYQYKGVDGSYHNTNGNQWVDNGKTMMWDTDTESSFEYVGDRADDAKKTVLSATSKEVTTWSKKKYKFNQFAFGVNTQLAPKWNLIAEGLYNNIGGQNDKGGDLDKKGFWARLTYGKMDWKKANTWKIYAEYFALGNASIDSKFWGHRLNIAGGNSNFAGTDDNWGNGDRGWGLVLDYMLAANTNFEFGYYKLKPFDKNASWNDFSRYDDVALGALTFSF